MALPPAETASMPRSGEWMPAARLWIDLLYNLAID